MNDTVITAIIAAVAAAGGGAMKGFWDNLRATRAGTSDREAHTETRLWERIELLETRQDESSRRLNEHDKYCDDKIASALTKSEAECDEKINRKLAAQAAQLRRELKRGLEEASNAE